MASHHHKRGASILLLVSVCFMFSMDSSVALQEPIPLPTCASDNSVCNIVEKNETMKSPTISRQCSCPGDKTCPTASSDERAALLIEDKLFFTCAGVAAVPVCTPGQVSLHSKSGKVERLENLEVLCACRSGYNLYGPEMTIMKDNKVSQVFCKGDWANTANEVPNTQAFTEEAEHSLDEHDTSDDYEEEEEKRSRGQSAFYKRRGLSGFYKRWPESAFYKRAPFYKRAAFYKREPAVSKRSASNLNDEHASNEDPAEFYEGDDQMSESFDYEKKDPQISSFYKRGFDNNRSAFYKRSREGLLSFYKKAPADDDAGALQPEEDDGDEMSAEKKSHGVNSFYKRSLFNFYKRNPWYSSTGASSFYKKRGVGTGTSAFYKRGYTSDLSSFYKRDGLSSFYKRNGDNSGLFGPYKKDFSGGKFRFYKRSAENVTAEYTENQQKADHVTDVQKRSTSIRTSGKNNEHKRTVRSISSFYKRDLNGNSAFYKRGPTMSNFYKRGNDLSNFYKPGNDLSNFYKRSDDWSNFYKRGDDWSNFYKRGNDLSNFYKRGNDWSNFYKRGSDLSNFYKRGNDLSNFYKRGDDWSNFYKRGNDLSNFYKRETDSLSSFYKRAPTASRFYKRYDNDLNAFYKRSPSNLNTFYKRSPNNLNAFYKRSPNNHSFFYKRSKQDLLDFLKAWQEKDLSRLYKSDDVSDNGDDYISGVDDENASNDSISSQKRASPNLSSFYKRKYQSAFY